MVKSDDWSKREIYPMFLTRALILALLLTGCTMIDMDQPPAKDFPKLAITEHYVSWAVMREKCQKADVPGIMSVGCTEYDLIRETCHIWLVADPPPSPETIAHERLHCAGYDHVGESTLQDAWQAVKQWRQQAKQP